MEDAGAFAEYVDGADARATGAEDVGVEDAEGGAAQVAGGDALDEAGDIDVCGAGGGAGRVEAVEAAVRLNDSGLGGERGLQLTEALAQMGVVR